MRTLLRRVTILTLILSCALNICSAASAQYKTFGPNLWQFPPKYSPDGTKLTVEIKLEKPSKQKKSKSKPKHDNDAEPTNKLAILNAKDFSLITEIDSNQSPSWSPNSKYVGASVDITSPSSRFQNMRMSVYDATTGAKLLSQEDEPPIWHSWAPDSRSITIGGEGEATVFDIETKQISSFREKNSNFISTNWSPDGQLVAASFSPKISNSPTERAIPAKISDDLERVIKIWNAKSKVQTAKLNVENGTDSFTWSPNGKFFIYREPYGIHFLSANTYKPVKTIKATKKGQISFFWSHDKKKFSYHNGHFLHILDADTMNEITSVELPSKSYCYTDWTPDDNFILISTSDTAAICDAKTGNYLGYKSWPSIFRQTITPDQKLIFTKELDSEEIKSEHIQLPPAQFSSPFVGGQIGRPMWK